jgi:hypothetical protein
VVDHGDAVRGDLQDAPNVGFQRGTT